MKFPKLREIESRGFVCYWHFVLDNISLGVSIDWRAPNLEIHLPFGFFIIGWRTKEIPWTLGEFTEKRTIGYEGEFKFSNKSMWQRIKIWWQKWISLPRERKI